MTANLTDPSTGNDFRRAVALHRKGDLGSAEALYRGLIDRAPGLVDVYSNLAALLKATGRAEEGLEMCVRALALTTNNHNTFVNQANILATLGRPREAIDAYVKALQLSPNMLSAHINLGNLLTELGEFTEAVKAYTRAAEIDPRNAEALAGLGHALSAQGKVPEAEQLLRKATRFAPEYAEGHCRLGQLLTRRGELREAHDEFEEAVRIKPDLAPALRQLVESEKWAHPAGPLVERLHEIADNATTSPNRVEACFALGKVYDDCGMYDEAFRYYREGNAARLRTRKFNAEEFNEYVDRLIGLFSSDFMRARCDYGSSSERPVFIVGMPRSGTTLVEQIVASHPRAFGAGELHAIPDIGLCLNRRIGSPLPFPECASSLQPDTALALAEEYSAFVGQIGGSLPVRITDKMPENFLYQGLIQLLFPNSRVIHCQRHPLDNGLSIFFRNFTTRNLYECELDSIGAFYRGYLRLMDHWRKTLSIRMLELSYEDLVADPAAGVRRIVAFLDLPWDDACLHFHQTRRSVFTASVRQVREPIYTKSVGRWKNYAKHLGPLKEALGVQTPGTADCDP